MKIKCPRCGEIIGFETCDECTNDSPDCEGCVLLELEQG